MKRFPFFIISVLFLFLFGSSKAFAVQISIDPVDFPGFVKLCKQVNGTAVCTHDFGYQTIDMPISDEFVMNAGGSSYIFRVDAYGNVSNPNPNAFEVSGNEIVFKTGEIRIDPGDHEGFWVLQNVGAYASAQTFPLLLGSDMFIGFASRDRLILKVSPAGDVVNDPGNPSYTASGNALIFNTVSVDIDPGDFEGDYFLHGFPGSRGPLTVNLIPGLAYNLFVNTPREGHRFEVLPPCGIDPSRLDYANSVFFEISCSPPPSIQVALDIKPGSCKNPINAKSKGSIPASILGTEDFDVSRINKDTIRLAGRESSKFSIEDVANAADCDGKDGLNDLTFKIKARTLINAIEDAVGGLNDGDVISVNVTGNLLDEFGGTEIVGSDDVLILKKGR